MYSSREEGINCLKGDIDLTIDGKTGIIFNRLFDESGMQYDKDYHNEQGLSHAFSQHLQEVAERIMRVMGKQNIVEIGCGKGLFLDMLSEKGVDITGFDPTYSGNNPRIIPEYFTQDTPISCDGIILRHVLEHIKNPADFLHFLKQAAPKHCKIYIEVPAFEWISNNNAWYDIFYEHVNYFRLNDFRRLFSDIIEGGYVFNDQYIYVIANLSDLREVPEVNDTDADFSFPIEQLIAEKVDRSKKIILWGGASKGVIFAMNLAWMGISVDHVIDINPKKQHRFLPATGIKVESPDEVLPQLADGENIYVMNSGYLAEIKQMTGQRFNYITLD
ncbi:methyltransferase domain-containing protein [Erwinia psidii]|uniref:Methyltransferase domain-containing protein n=2 Tax=Erwinia psidii TaxID=69224 RepID=A0A3N6S1B4_9GAMM|nr:methyltransferase domain-containing protein [Erwinia psidii]MCX8959945.1 methyltransferase domain-containing protein [Erwinia psidii]MCX8963491.1 methyltransferase domain-containing protein [Erwinia psidii]RQM39368.1 methyltransferase domain-containing protein [Erwinia psidii]